MGCMNTLQHSSAQVYWLSFQKTVDAFPSGMPGFAPHYFGARKILPAKCTGARSHNGNATTRSLERLKALPDAEWFGSRETE
jgi:hypothetical protein